MLDYNLGLRRQSQQFNSFIEKGKVILTQIVEEFGKLNASPDSICKLVDNDTKLLIKFLGVSILIVIDKLQDKYGSLIIYKADRWSLDWVDYKIPINADIQFDELGNLFYKNELIGGIAPPQYKVLELAIQVGRDHK